MRKEILALAGLAAVSCGQKAKQQPNIIYVFPDQLRDCALGFWNEPDFASSVRWSGDPVETPNINAFARESVVLTNAVSNFPVSSPHRGMLLSGMYPERNGVVLNCMALRPESQLRQDAECISDVLSANGYDCGYIGKLHVDCPTPNNPQAPGTYVSDRRPEWDAYTAPERRHGFNYWYSYGTYDVHKHPHYWDTDGNRHDVDEWSPKHETDKALDYIRNRHGERDSSKPFFLMMGINPPHSPYASVEDCDIEGYDLYKDMALSELLVRPNADTTMSKAEAARYYFANISGIDREFGRLLSLLDSTGLSRNTIIVFASDHGETMTSHSCTDPKNSIYTESLNIPFIIRWPGHLEPHTEELLLSTPDIMPTLLGLSGLGNRIPKSVEGQDFSAILKEAEHQPERPKTALYIRNLDGPADTNGLIHSFFPEARGIRTATNTFELSIDRNGQLKSIKMFDDIADPYQLENLDPDEHPELFHSLCKLLATTLEEKSDIWARERILDGLLGYQEDSKVAAVR